MSRDYAHDDVSDILFRSTRSIIFRSLWCPSDTLWLRSLFYDRSMFVATVWCSLRYTNQYRHLYHAPLLRCRLWLQDARSLRPESQPSEKQWDGIWFPRDIRRTGTLHRDTDTATSRHTELSTRIMDHDRSDDLFCGISLLEYG